MKNLKGTLLLLISALIWGTSFVAQTSASSAIGSFTFNGVRSLIGAAFLFGLLLVRKATGKSPESDIAMHDTLSLKAVLVGGVLCGIVLCIAANFQQFGIAAYPPGAATSGRAGFITATYVVFVAICELLKNKKTHPIILISVLLCIVGMYFLCLSGGISGIYLGDILVLIGAFAFTAHILIIDHFSHQDGIKLSCVQFITHGMISLICAFIFEEPNFTQLVDAWLPILYTGILSSGIAFTLQIIAQKFVSPAVASIAMSMESVFAVVAGWILLNEHLTPRELFGCALVFSAVILSQIPSNSKNKKIPVK